MEKANIEEGYTDTHKGLWVSKISRIKNQITYNFGQSRMVNKIQIGIARDEFTMFYQPEYNLETNEIVGVEALVRWISPQDGMISPDNFIPLAERSHLIHDLERVIIRKALMQKQIWEQEGLGHIELSINLSSKTLESENHFESIEKIIRSFHVNYEKVIFEITETVIISDVSLAMERLKRLRSYGIKIALDDFGTGFSSLIHLIKLPIDIIKIDRNFIRSIPESEGETTITKNILTMAHDLKYKVVAEGIETKEQLEYLQQNSCQGGQGYLLCVPLPSGEVTQVIKGSK